MELLLTPVIRKIANPRMSTYWLDVDAVAMSSMTEIRWVTGCPAEFVPVARIVSGYSPGPSDPPLIETLIVWVSPFARVKLDGVTVTAPSPTGSTPLAAGPPSTDTLTVSPETLNALDPVFDVEMSKLLVDVPPVAAMSNRVPNPVVVKSRPTAP